MTLSEQFRAEGRAEGRIEGKLEIAKQLLAKNMEFNFISEITGLPLKQLEELK